MRNSLRITCLSIILVTGALASCSPESDPGAQVWRKKCAACHGEGGDGRTRFAEGRPFANLTDGRWKHGSDRASIRRLVAEGDPASTMPPFSGRLTPEEIDAVVDYARRLATPGSPGAKP
jgi:mono/diheme cytochrome c family protein